MATSLALPMGLLLSFISQLSLRMQMGSSKSTYPISAQTLRRRPRNEGRVFGSACATLKLGTSSRLIWNPKSRSLDSKSTACGSDRTIPTTSSSRLSLSSNEAPFKGKVFRSDSGEAISNSYILLTSEKDQANHFDTRTDENGEYLFGGIPGGNYSVSIYAWFPRRSEVPCQDPLKQKTVEGGDITVELQWKSRACMEIVILKGFFHRIKPGECQRLRFGGQVKHSLIDCPR